MRGSAAGALFLLLPITQGYRNRYPGEKLCVNALLKNIDCEMRVFEVLIREGCVDACVVWKLGDVGKLERSGAGLFLAGTKPVIHGGHPVCQRLFGGVDLVT